MEKRALSAAPASFPEVAPRPPLDATRRRKRLREARQAVSQAIIDRTWNRVLPGAVEQFIKDAWANLLVLIYLHRGSDTDEWRTHLAAIDDLLDGLQPGTCPPEGPAAGESLPELEQRIRAGLARIGNGETGLESLLAGITAPPPATARQESPPAKAAGVRLSVHAGSVPAHSAPAA
jgi:hypothetical protein